MKIRLLPILVMFSFPVAGQDAPKSFDDAVNDSMGKYTQLFKQPALTQMRQNIVASQEELAKVLDRCEEKELRTELDRLLPAIKALSRKERSLFIDQGSSEAREFFDENGWSITASERQVRLTFWIKLDATFETMTSLLLGLPLGMDCDKVKEDMGEVRFLHSLSIKEGMK